MGRTYRFWAGAVLLAFVACSRSHSNTNSSDGDNGQAGDSSGGDSATSSSAGAGGSRASSSGGGSEAVGTGGGGGSSSHGGTTGASGAAGSPGDGGTAATGGTGGVALTCPPTLDAADAELRVGSEEAVWLASYVNGLDTSRVHLAGAPTGGFYVAGRTVGAVDETQFGGIGLATRNGRALGFVARVDADGEAAWALPVLPTNEFADDSSWSPPELSPVPTADGAYLVGVWADPNTNDPADFVLDGATLTAGSTQELLIGHVSEQGDLDFLDPVGEFSGVDSVYAVVDGLGRLVVVANYPEGVSFDQSHDCGVVLTIFDGSELVVERCVTTTADSFVLVDAIAAGPDGEVFVSGFPGLSYDVGFGPTEIDASGGASVLVKLDAQGDPAWVQEFLRSYAWTLQVDAEGNLFVAGHVPGFREDSSAVFAGDEFACPDTFQRHLTKLSPDGTRLFTRRFDSFNQSSFMDADSNLFLTVSGEADTDVVPGVPHAGRDSVLKLDAEGSIVWQQPLIPNAGDLYVSSGLAVDGSGRVYTSGLAQGSVAIDSGAELELGSYLKDVFIRWE